MSDSLGEPVCEREFERWLTPVDALAQLAVLGDGALDALRRYLIGGRLSAASRDSTFSKNGSSTTMVFGAQIPPKSWKLVKPYDRVWQQASHVFKDSDRYGNVITLEAFGIRFEPNGINQILKDAGRLAVSPDSGAPVKTTSARRGAKRRDWWDLLWIEMIRRIEDGTLNPKRVGELQTEMLNWLGEKHGIFPGGRHGQEICE